MLYFSLIFTTIFLPMKWIYYRIPTMDYYLISFVVMFIGGVIFNIILSIKFHGKREEIKNGFPKGIVLKIFGWKLAAYTVLFFVVVFLTSDIKSNLYFVLFLMFGGYSWFCILQGYIQAKNDKEGKNESLKQKSWLERILFFSIALSLLLGYLHGLG
jgi:hypothetical protein